MNPIHFPRRNYGDFSNPLTDLMEIRRKMIDGLSCSFDLSQSIFLSPLLLCGAAALARQSFERGTPMGPTIEPNYPEIRSFLAEVGFPDGHWDAAPSFAARRKLVSLQTRNFIPLIAFDVNARSTLKEQLIQAFELLLDRQVILRGDGMAALRYYIAELTNNIGDHAGFGSGFVMAQFRKTLHCIDLAIVDTGAGLRQNYLTNGEPAATDAIAINKALRGVSTKRDAQIGRGWGLHTSRDMLVKGMKGEFFLWTGDACLIHNQHRENLFEMGDGTTFPGCYLALRIPTTYDPTFKWSDYAEK